MTTTMNNFNPGSLSVGSSRSCFLVFPEVPGDFDIGAKVQKGHPVSEWGVALSKTIKHSPSGTLQSSARAVGSPMTVTLQKTGHLPEFLNIVNNGTTVPKVDIFVLKNHGPDDATADVVLQITLTNVRFQAGEINVKRQAGGYTTGPKDVLRSREIGWASDADPNALAQAENPNNIGSIEDVFVIEITYDAIAGVWSKIEPNGAAQGNISFYYSFAKNNTTAPS